MVGDPLPIPSHAAMSWLRHGGSSLLCSTRSRMKNQHPSSISMEGIVTSIALLHFLPPLSLSPPSSSPSILTSSPPLPPYLLSSSPSHLLSSLSLTPLLLSLPIPYPSSPFLSPYPSSPSLPSSSPFLPFSPSLPFTLPISPTPAEAQLKQMNLSESWVSSTAPPTNGDLACR